MPVNWAPFVEFVRSHQRFVLTTHVRPDGDGLGSILAMDEVLRGMGKEVRLVIASSFPPRYNFLNTAARVRQFEAPGEEYRDADAIVVMDTGTWNQLGDFGSVLRSSMAKKAVIDHHQTQDDLGAVRFVDASAESTGRLTYEAIQALGASLNETVATYLLVAVGYDTGWFRHSNVTASTLSLAATLVAAGARLQLVHESLYEQSSFPRLKLAGRVLERLQLEHANRVACSWILRKDYPELSAVPQDSEDLINYISGIAGVEVRLLFMEQPRGGVKVSFRSRRIDVSKVAERFGGGGHRLASGATLETTLDDARTRVLEAVGAALDLAG